MSKYTTPGQRIAELREKYGSYRKVSAEVGVSLGHLWEIESGRRPIESLTVGTIRKLGLECGPAFKRT